MIRVIVCDDHPIFREGVKNIINQSRDVVVEAEAQSGQELKEKLSAGRFDVIVLDISLADSHGLDLLKTVRATYPDTPVLILSMHDEELYALRVLRAGAAGYVNKSSPPVELLSALRKVARGGKYVSPTLAELLAFDLDKKRDSPGHVKLSDREHQVLCMLASGKGIKEIAELLYLSPPTVSTYRSRILEKLNLRNTAELVHYAITNRLV